MGEHVRLQFEVDQKEMEGLEGLARLGGLRTKKDLLSNALTLLKWAARERAAGCVIVSMNKAHGVVKELEMPFLETVASRSRPEQSPDDPLRLYLPRDHLPAGIAVPR